MTYEHPNPDDDYVESQGVAVADLLAPGLREKYPTLDRILKNPAYDGKAVKAEIWDALLEITKLRATEAERGRYAQPVRAPGCDTCAWKRAGGTLTVVFHGHDHRVVAGQTVDADLLDFAIFARDAVGGYATGREVPASEMKQHYEFRDDHGFLWSWDTHIRDYPHAGLYVWPRPGVGA